MVLRLQDVSVASPTRGPAGAIHNLVDQVSLQIAAGEVLAIIGPNGAGKSTLLKAISGDMPYSGEISIEGVAEREPQRARQIAVLPQQSLLNFPYRVFEVVGLGRIPHASGHVLDDQIVDEALALMDASYLRDRIYTELSGGEKQRVQLARVLSQIWRAEDADNETRLLLLDEPTAALDLGHQRELLETVTKFAKQGVAVVMVLHDVNLAARYADKVLALLCSQAVAFGRPKDVITAENIGRLFDLDVHVVPHPEADSLVVIPK